MQLDGCVFASATSRRADWAMGRRGLLDEWVRSREEERVLAEALWSRPTVRIGGLEEDF
jgi:hypothetical protein